ncbi:Hypothetical predicted protein [Octopus vulgaris]|uniref:Uncharacterized protein n=1 Tax=Octopus vulgaris TaxID=6645 RepID=A0AA36F7Y4_OCTVU|nr:Hypothetical predicted protein [Octopus vulgaris]
MVRYGSSDGGDNGICRGCGDNSGEIYDSNCCDVIDERAWFVLKQQELRVHDRIYAYSFRIVIGFNKMTTMGKPRNCSSGKSNSMVYDICSKNLNSSIAEYSNILVECERGS